MRVLYRKVELTGPKQAANLGAGKIERSAEALRIYLSVPFPHSSIDFIFPKPKAGEMILSYQRFSV
jgi:hypothetical protein